MALYYNALWPSEPFPDAHIQHSLLILLSSQLPHWVIQTVHRIIVLAEQRIILRKRTLVFKDKGWNLGQWIKPEDMRDAVTMAGDRPEAYCWWADVEKRLGVLVDEKNVLSTGRQTNRGMRQMSPCTKAKRPPPFLPLASSPQPRSHEAMTYLRTPPPSLVFEELHSEELVNGPTLLPTEKQREIFRTRSEGVDAALATRVETGRRRLAAQSQEKWSHE
ncbi:hypothetical protein DACRYDRAFT_109118 [Dacryopinax primogenitus]|uniref:Uncharacterized protein n=1 Tax=Dacryopinax primogenitus (strain DJM 731) TaxID=1858805 RepID=M5FVN7_DACPD|nr:uncharacterized protein DACRYDRAFT_109118 [Dacryopinax primogenitus]EJU00389.1 hypothetical protein DACRYDRAFT_109118 [Dacryopinax primogenitus]